MPSTTELRHPAIVAVDTIATALDSLAAANLWSLPDRQLGELLLDLERLARRLAHAQLTALGQAAGSKLPTRDGATSLPAWLKATADVPIGTAKARLALHAALRNRSATETAFAAGDISMDAAAAVCAALNTLPAAVPAALIGDDEELLVDTARDEDTRAVSQCAAEITHRFAPEELEHDEQAQHNRLRLTLHPNGTVALRGVLDKEAGALAYTVLGPLAAPRPAVDGTPDLRDGETRYGEALIQALTMASAATPETRGERPHVVVTIGLETLQRNLGNAPGRLDTGAPISAAAARRLACDAGVIPLVLGTNSEPLDIGRASRIVPTGLRRALVARDQGCAFPGCDRPTGWCDAHHCKHWADGGRTALSNLVMLCARHHSIVHHDGWAVELVKGLPRFTPPRWIDPDQKPRLHSRYRHQTLGP